MDKFVLTPKEAADYVGLGENKIRQLIKEGSIPAARSGRNYKIPRPLLEKWIIEVAKRGKAI